MPKTVKTALWICFYILSFPIWFILWLTRDL